MPQLIAMVIVVVAAMIYMFQTFGGTGDKIEGVAQKTSIVSEIQTLKEDIRFADGYIEYTSATDYTTLKKLAEEGFFADSVREQLNDIASSADIAVKNTYKAISFGERDDGLKLSLVPLKSGYPGLFVDLSGAQFAGKRSFLEKELTKDLTPLYAVNNTAKAWNDDIGEDLTDGLPVLTDDGGDDTDGLFIVYFKDLETKSYVK